MPTAGLETSLFLDTKLHAPRPKAGLLVRARLLSLIRENLDRRLISVVSGAGYGKTTLMAQLLETERLRAMFLSLEPSDSDPAVFISYLLAGLIRLASSVQRSTISQSLQEALERLSRVRWPAAPSVFATELINELSAHRSDDLYVILDDYHWLAPDSGVNRLVDFLVDRMPSNLHLVVCSRAPLPLPSLPKWRSKQDAFELDQQDLAFGEAELRALMEQAYRASLPESELARVMDQTRGWITGIHLIMQAAGMHKSVKETLNGYVAANRPLFEYFASEILGKEEEPVRRFLVETSTLETLSGAACDHLLQRSGSAKMLRDLERRNVFMTEAAAGEYRHHPLFRNYLRDALTDPARARSLHARAAEFYRRHGRTEEAVDHYLLAGEADRAASLIAAGHGSYVDAARFDILGRWFSALPPQAFVSHPQLLLPLARWQLEQRLPEEQRSTLRRAVELLGRAKDPGNLCQALLCLGQTQISDRDCRAAVRTISRGIRLCPRSRPQLRAELHNICGQAWLWLGRYQKAGSYYRQALRIARAAGLPLAGQVKIIVDLCVLQARLGDYRTAYRSYRSLALRLRPDFYYLGIGSFYGSAAKAAMTLGELPPAELFIARGRQACQRSQDTRSLAMLSIMEAQLDIFYGRWDRAEERLGKLEESCASLGSPEYLEAVWRARAQLCRYRGRLDEARRFMANFVGQFDRPPENYVTLRGLSEKGFLEAAAGSLDEAGRTAAAMGKAAARFGDRLGMYYSQLLLALACRGRPALSQRHFNRALEMAGKWGYLGILALEIRNNPALRPMLPGIQGSGRYGKLLAGLAGPGVFPEARTSDRVRLLVRLFGQVEISLPSGAGVSVPWRTRRVVSLFAYLAANRDRFCHTEELIGALWLRAGLRKAKGQLYQAVSLLRDNLRAGLESAGIPVEAIGDPVVRQSQSYKLLPDFDLVLDTEEFMGLWKERIQLAPADDPALADACRRALTLYRGPFLPPSGDPWCEEKRDSHYKIFLAIKERLARCLAASQQPQLAAMHFSEYLEQEPFAEHVRLQYWKALLRSGNRREITADHVRYAKMLRRELGQPPGPELTAFLRSLA